MKISSSLRSELFVSLRYKLWVYFSFIYLVSCSIVFAWTYSYVAQDIITTDKINDVVQDTISMAKYEPYKLVNLYNFYQAESKNGNCTGSKPAGYAPTDTRFEVASQWLAALTMADKNVRLYVYVVDALTGETVILVDSGGDYLFCTRIVNSLAAMGTVSRQDASVVYANRAGVWQSAYTPVRVDGTVSGMGVSVNVLTSYFNDRQKSVVTNIIVFCSLLWVSMSVTLIYMLRYLTDPLTKITDALVKFRNGQYRRAGENFMSFTFPDETSVLAKTAYEILTLAVAREKELEKKIQDLEECLRAKPK